MSLKRYTIRETHCWPCVYQVGLAGRGRGWWSNDTWLFCRTIEDCLDLMIKHGWEWDNKVIMLGEKGSWH